ncbi:hypothetical protein [Rhizobium lentis]|uniref:DUF541 domain-containing protein n=1 Tax=Rhizobium lentis TaxID=1138194 RepID=A0A7W8UJC2_9HYPH|nr:hypothetical protein [Rhizobium lentis]MBB4572263.1 hypothetical protein [Rhizobium lentis]MBB5548546.1 hypothetical protein [Rhizobium lentis]MBB5559076.1 hypothetical protein [Rhizobium lentis]MBB5565401.1 hypothetical protein [Rhizobium lentis]
MIATRFCSAVTVFTFAVTGAFAQTALPRNGTIPEGYITAQSSISLSLPFDQSAQMDEQVQKAQKALYNIASRNCSVVVETIAEDCKITGITNNVDMQRGNNRDGFISVRGQISMAIKLKPSMHGSK